MCTWACSKKASSALSCEWKPVDGSRGRPYPSRAVLPSLQEHARLDSWLDKVLIQILVPSSVLGEGTKLQASRTDDVHRIGGTRLQRDQTENESDGCFTYACDELATDQRHHVGHGAALSRVDVGRIHVWLVHKELASHRVDRAETCTSQ